MDRDDMDARRHQEALAAAQSIEKITETALAAHRALLEAHLTAKAPAGGADERGPTNSEIVAEFLTEKLNERRPAYEVCLDKNGFPLDEDDETPMRRVRVCPADFYFEVKDAPELVWCRPTPRLIANAMAYVPGWGDPRHRRIGGAQKKVRFRHGWETTKVDWVPANHRRRKELLTPALTRTSDHKGPMQ